MRVGDSRDRAVLERLYPLYLHDLSEFTRHYSLDEHGRWQPDYLSDWLGRRECSSLLVRVGGTPAGFALIAERPFPFMSTQAEVRLAEFFVARPFRGRGVGRAGATAAFDSFHGRWQVNVIAANEPAIAFWRRVVSDYTDGRFQETVDSDDVTFWLAT